VLLYFCSLLCLPVVSFIVDNFDYLTGYFDKVIAVDWLGMGCSSRTSTRVSRLSVFTQMRNCSNKEEQEKLIATQVTNEFIDSLEELRKTEKIEDFILAGHSLGGYLSGKYALKYPKDVKGLILISPVGIPEQPAKEDRIDNSDLNWRIRFMSRLWNLGVTPQSLIRIIGSRGPEYVESFIGKRFSHRWQGISLQFVFYLFDYFSLLFYLLLYL
jgi:cardiolipin-specific phospholipase